MVKKSDLDDLFNSIKYIDTEPNGYTLPDVAESLGKNKMKNQVLQVMQDWYATSYTRETKK